MGELINFHKSNEISAFFNGQYSEDIIKKVTEFYFNEHNVENETTRLENICHVSIYY